MTAYCTKSQHAVCRQTRGCLPHTHSSCSPCLLQEGPSACLPAPCMLLGTSFAEHLHHGQGSIPHISLEEQGSFTSQGGPAAAPVRVPQGFVQASSPEHEWSATEGLRVKSDKVGGRGSSQGSTGCLPASCGHQNLTGLVGNSWSLGRHYTSTGSSAGGRMSERILRAGSLNEVLWLWRDAGDIMRSSHLVLLGAQVCRRDICTGNSALCLDGYSGIGHGR